MIAGVSGTDLASMLYAIHTGRSWARVPSSQRALPVSSRERRNCLTTLGESPLGSTETATICMIDGSGSDLRAAASPCIISGQTSGQCAYTNVRKTALPRSDESLKSLPFWSCSTICGATVGGETSNGPDSWPGLRATVVPGDDETRAAGAVDEASSLLELPPPQAASASASTTSAEPPLRQPFVTSFRVVDPQIAPHR